MLSGKRNQLVKLSVNLSSLYSNFFFINFNTRSGYLVFIRNFVKINYFNQNNLFFFFNKNSFVVNFEELQLSSFFIFLSELEWNNIKFFGIYFKNNYLNCKSKFDLQFFLDKFFNVNSYFYYKMIEIYLYILFFIVNFFYKIVFLLRSKC